MELGQISAGYKWVVDVNKNAQPDPSEVTKKAEDAFSLPITKADCLALGLVWDEKYSIENVNDLVQTINAAALEASQFFQNATRLFQQKSYPAAQAEYDRAAQQYASVLELYTVLIAIAERQDTDVLKAALSEFRKNYETIQQNLKVAKQNSATAAYNQQGLELKAENDMFVQNYERVQAAYNEGITAYNSGKYAEALAVFTTTVAQAQQLLLDLDGLGKKYPQADFSSHYKVLEGLLADAAGLVEITKLQVP